MSSFIISLNLSKDRPGIVIAVLELLRTSDMRKNAPYLFIDESKYKVLLSIRMDFDSGRF